MSAKVRATLSYEKCVFPAYKYPISAKMSEKHHTEGIFALLIQSCELCIPKKDDLFPSDRRDTRYERTRVELIS